MPKYPVLIPFQQTHDDGLELRYTLRALKNIEQWNGEVILCGDKPDWVQNVTHVKARPSNNRYIDAELKIRAGLEVAPETFIFMNDDIMCLEPTNIKDWYAGELKQTGTGPHQANRLYTRNWLLDRGYEPLDYSLHTPMIMNRDKRKQVSDIVMQDHSREQFRILLARTLYGSMFITEPELRQDHKIRGGKFIPNDIISTGSFIKELEDLFPEPSKFENDALRVSRYIKSTQIKKSSNKYPIPKIIHQVWIGPLLPPTKWLDTWKEKNPDWEYIFWDNEKVFSRKWKNQHLIDEYLKRAEEVELSGEFISSRGAVFRDEKATLFAWHVIADILRYEILYEYGGYMPGADSECIKNITPKFNDCDFGVYTVRTGNLYETKYSQIKNRIKERGNLPTKDEKLSLNRYAPENASPILACKPKNEFAGQLIDELHKLKPHQLGEAVDTTGNVFMGKMIRKYKPKDLYMINYEVNKERIKQDNYSIHYAGTTKNRYKYGRL